MSSLNINNLDVQRIINLVSELFNKVSIVSFLTFKSLTAFKENINEIKLNIGDESTVEMLSDHFDLMNDFRDTHLLIKKEIEESEKNKEDQEEFLEDGEGKEPQETYIMKDNLEGIDSYSLTSKHF